MIARNLYYYVILLAKALINLDHVIGLRNDPIVVSSPNNEPFRCRKGIYPIAFGYFLTAAKYSRYDTVQYSVLYCTCVERSRICFYPHDLGVPPHCRYNTLFGDGLAS